MAMALSVHAVAVLFFAAYYSFPGETRHSKCAGAAEGNLWIFLFMLVICVIIAIASITLALSALHYLNVNDNNVC